MSPEVWIGITAVFISGGAVGTAGTLLAVWLLRRIEGPVATPPRLPRVESDMLRADLDEVARRLRNIDQRLDFQEQLLGGGSPTTTPPPRIAGTWSASHGQAQEIEDGASAPAEPPDEGAVPG